MPADLIELLRPCVHGPAREALEKLVKRTPADVIIYRQGETAIAVDGSGNMIAASKDHDYVIDKVFESGKVIIIRDELDIKKPHVFENISDLVVCGYGKLNIYVTDSNALHFKACKRVKFVGLTFERKVKPTEGAILRFGNKFEGVELWHNTFIGTDDEPDISAGVAHVSTHRDDQPQGYGINRNFVAIGNKFINASYGINAMYCDDILIVGNYFEDVGYLAAAAGIAARKFTIAGNIVDGIRHDEGLAADAGTTTGYPARWGTISGNMVYGSAGVGIAVISAVGVNVCGNIVQGTYVGIKCGRWAQNVNIVGNVVNECVWGIQLDFTEDVDSYNISVLQNNIVTRTDPARGVIIVKRGSTKLYAVKILDNEIWTRGIAVYIDKDATASIEDVMLRNRIRLLTAAASKYSGLDNITNLQLLEDQEGLATDIEFTDPSKGVILIDRTTGTKYRLYVDNGTLGIESVS